MGYLDNNCCNKGYSCTQPTTPVVNETIAKVEDVVVGHKIAKYTNEKAEVVTINETISPLTILADNIASYKDETGFVRTFLMGGVSPQLGNAATLINGLIYVPISSAGTIAIPISDSFTLGVGDPLSVTTSFPINPNYHYFVFRNGARQLENLDFVKVGQTISFTTAFQNTEIIIIDYYKN